MRTLAAPCTLRLALAPSWGFAAVLICTHLAVAWIVWSARLPVIPMIAVLLAIAASLAGTTWAAALRRAPRSIVALEFDADGIVRTRQRNGVWIEWAVAGSTFVSRPLMVLNLRRPQKPVLQAVVIPADAASAEELRALRVWLRWRANPAAASPSGP